MQDSIAEELTDEGFEKRIQPIYHKSLPRTPLEELNVPMVTGMPIDPMHCIDIGIGKKILKQLKAKKITAAPKKNYWRNSMKSIRLIRNLLRLSFSANQNYQVLAWLTGRQQTVANCYCTRVLSSSKNSFRLIFMNIF